MMLDNTARMVATVGIWGSWAVLLASGLCQMHFGDPAPFLIALTIICITALAATAVVWRAANRRDHASRHVPGGFPVVNVSPVAPE